MKTKFYRCNICGNIIVKHIDSGVTPWCCDTEMEEVVPQTEELGHEKHLPLVTFLNDQLLKVNVGSIEHPMSPTHHIEFIYLETERGGSIVNLKPSDLPEVFLAFTSKPVAVFAYCNIHNLWVTKIEK